MNKEEIIQTFKIIETNRDVLRALTAITPHIPEFKIRNPYDQKKVFIKALFYKIKKIRENVALIPDFDKKLSEEASVSVKDTMELQLILLEKLIWKLIGSFADEVKESVADLLQEMEEMPKDCLNSYGMGFLEGEISVYKKFSSFLKEMIDET